MKLPARGAAGGKVILLGEHAVVYGRPALVAGVPRRLDVTLDAGDGPQVRSTLVADGRSEPAALGDDPRPVDLLRAVATVCGLDPGALVATVRSELPIGAGLGSSAALIVAMLRAAHVAAGTSIDDLSLIGRARELERLFHGWSSGVDPAAAALGGCFRYALPASAVADPTAAPPAVIERVHPGALIPLVIARRPVARRTSTAVGGLRDRWLADRARYDALFDRVAVLVDRAAAAVRAGDLSALGVACEENQAVLETLGVSTPDSRALIDVACGAGALGAKMTGGGAGGAIIAVARDPVPVEAALRAVGAQTLMVQIATSSGGVDGR